MSASSPVHLGCAIRALRTARQLSIEALAAAADIHTTYLSGIERGRGNPSWRVVGSLANALEVEISELAHQAERIAHSESGKAP